MASPGAVVCILQAASCKRSWSPPTVVGLAVLLESASSSTFMHGMKGVDPSQSTFLVKPSSHCSFTSQAVGHWKPELHIEEDD